MSNAYPGFCQQRRDQLGVYNRLLVPNGLRDEGAQGSDDARAAVAQYVVGFPAGAVGLAVVVFGRKRRVVDGKVGHLGAMINVRRSKVG